MNPHYRPVAPPDERGVIVDVDPANAEWEFAALRVIELRTDRPFTVEASDFEWIVLPLVGGASVVCNDEELVLQGRPSVFERVSDFAYVPRDATAQIRGASGSRVALTGARADAALTFRYGRADDVPVELRGAGNASRQCNNFASPDGFDTDRLVAVEVIVPGGNWASYPPHKHDVERAGEAQLEEIYYFEIRGGTPHDAPGPGGYQRVYASSADRPIDVVAEVKTGDVVLIPYGYHGPTMAAPGYDLYFLNVLAGPATPRTMAFCDDPAHAWIRGSWSSQAIDQRLPMSSHRGPT